MAAAISGAEVLGRTVAELSQRAPAVVAAAASTLNDVRLRLSFGDGSMIELYAERNRLVTAAASGTPPGVEIHFDARAMNAVFDLAGRPIENAVPGSLDIRGERSDVLAAWRALRLFAQRGAGLRAVQEIWRRYRARSPALWGSPPPPARERSRPATGWTALDFLDDRAALRAGDLAAGTVVARTRSLWDGHTSIPWGTPEQVWDADLVEVMRSCRDRVATEMAGLIPDHAPQAALYDLMRSYPARQGKGLRPTLTIAACGAFGGRPEDAVRVAAALELFHNGFLVHDDISDESTHRRGKPTLHMAHGVGLAVNAGDGLNLLAIDAVLSNLESLGLARTLGLIHEVLHMCKETVEGQAIELEWIRKIRVPKSDAAYHRMSTKKTGWYTCISPCRLGAVCAGETDPARLDAMNETFRLIGIAFQIQDDVLNLIGEEELYGKEPLGDLLEGKRTVMLIHLMRTASADDRAEAYGILSLPRAQKVQPHAERLLELMNRYESIDYARGVAESLAVRGVRRFEKDLAFIEENESKGILRQIANYVTTRPL